MHLHYVPFENAWLENKYALICKANIRRFGSVAGKLIAAIFLQVTVAEEKLTDAGESGDYDTDLATWLCKKKFAKLETSWRKFPSADLFADGKREIDLTVLGVEGQVIYARPTSFGSLYQRLDEV